MVDAEADNIIMVVQQMAAKSHETEVPCDLGGISGTIDLQLLLLMAHPALQKALCLARLSPESKGAGCRSFPSHLVKWSSGFSSGGP